MTVISRPRRFCVLFFRGSNFNDQRREAWSLLIRIDGFFLFGSAAESITFKELQVRWFFFLRLVAIDAFVLNYLFPDLGTRQSAVVF